MTAVAGYGGRRANWFGSKKRKARFKAAAKPKAKKIVTRVITKQGRPTGVSAGRDHGGRWTKDQLGRFTGSVKAGG